MGKKNLAIFTASTFVIWITYLLTHRIMSEKQADVIWVLISPLLLLFNFNLLKDIKKTDFNLIKLKFNRYFLAFIALAVPFMLYGSKRYPLNPEDYFHFGEYLLPFQQYKIFGLRPYLDLIPPHGFINYVPGFISNIFFHEVTPGGVLWGMDFFSFVVFLTSQLVVYMASGSLLIPLFLALSSFFWKPAVYLSCACIAAVILNNQKRSWFFYFTLLFLSHLCAHLELSLGVPLLLMMLLVLIGQLFSSASLQYNKKPIFISLIIYSTLGFCSLIVFNHFYFELFQILISFSKKNLAAFGIPFSRSFGNPISVLFIKFWMFSSFLVTLSMWFILHEPRQKTVFAAKFIFLILTSNYAAGRVDSDFISRIGQLGLIYFWVDLALYFNLVWSKFRLQFCLVLAVFYVSTTGSISLAHVMSFNFFSKRVYTGAKLSVDESLARLNRFVLEFSNQKDDFLDLTNNNSYYYYLGKKVPARLSSFYTILGGKVEVELFNVIERVNVVLIDGHSRFHDGIRVFDRIPSVAIKLVNDPDFCIVKKDEFVFLVRKKVIPKLDQCVSDKAFATAILGVRNTKSI